MYSKINDRGAKLMIVNQLGTMYFLRLYNQRLYQTFQKDYQTFDQASKDSTFDPIEVLFIFRNLQQYKRSAR